jgi:hypothetical protein
MVDCNYDLDIRWSNSGLRCVDISPLHSKLVCIMDRDLRDSMKESQRKKRVAEYLDKLMKERNIRIEEIDSTGWHQLVRDAENLVKNDERI